MKILRMFCVLSGFLTLVLSLSAQTFTVLDSFDFTNGDTAYGGLVQATDGNLYGTTASGGANGGGTVFKITPNGALTTLYSFCAQSNCTDGYYPYVGLVQGSNGNFYGTTLYGGANLVKGLALARCSKSPRAALIRRFTAFAPKLIAPTATPLTLHWCRERTGISTEPRPSAVPT